MEALEPAVIFTGTVEQPAIAVPDITDGAGEIVNVLVDVAGVQFPYPGAVNVNTTLPAAISEALGVYVVPGFTPLANVTVPNVPVPLLVHVEFGVFVGAEGTVIFTDVELEHVPIAAVPIAMVGAEDILNDCATQPVAGPTPL